MKKKVIDVVGALAIGSLCFAGNVSAGHVHPISEVTGLQGALDAKASQVNLDATNTAVATKANQADLDATNSAVTTKADQSAVAAALATKAVGA